MNTTQYYKTERYRKSLHEDQYNVWDLTNTQIVWDVLITDKPHLELAPFPDYDGLSDAFLFSFGAGDIEVRHASFSDRKVMLYEYYFRWLLHDGFAARDLHKSLLRLAEYRDLLPDDVLYDSDLTTSIDLAELKLR